MPLPSPVPLYSSQVRSIDYDSMDNELIDVRIPAHTLWNMSSTSTGPAAAASSSMNLAPSPQKYYHHSDDRTLFVLVRIVLSYMKEFLLEASASHQPQIVLLGNGPGLAPFQEQPHVGVTDPTKTDTIRIMWCGEHGDVLQGLQYEFCGPDVKAATFALGHLWGKVFEMEMESFLEGDSITSSSRDAPDVCCYYDEGLQHPASILVEFSAKLGQELDISGDFMPLTRPRKDCKGEEKTVVTVSATVAEDKKDRRRGLASHNMSREGVSGTQKGEGEESVTP